ncbi:storkhead-box protein 1 isoform X1 [Arvicanthis niloticus]|uniref:storkhead-box protein 1 isoform X1 n=1 Tax=Arvicanthis niloticus TaxID=61156 RepID=UPI001486A7EC|nr:storkhead-box protein 1 isoform X1 [Arvicanthis niloticus]
MAQPVQLAPGSLALVLSPRETGQEAGEPGGRALFRAFRRANARCFWNARLARAASRLAFLGWLRRGVLLVRAPRPCVQVLRDAWRRRALRPPRGFRITAVGDVLPVQMSPIAQCRFVSLAEVLCCAIADMNALQVAVTQESLFEHLMEHYPGIAIPSPDILYSTLGALIQQRKIYHTGEGYFIVTPGTYFITNMSMQGNKRALQSDEGCSGPTSGTYLVSVDCCAEPTQENKAPFSHCPSCHCYPSTNMHDSKDLLAATEMTRKKQEGLDEPMALTKNQVVSASEDTHICVSSKLLPYTKDKGKRFGFRFLWRSLSRKEKAKVEYHSFSAQFPPEEWPVRDEDSSNNIPRDVEHAIIRRINPVLTVDNLTKHTTLMQKYEEQKKYNSQGMSTDILTTRHKYSSKEAIRKRQGQFAKPHRRSCSHRGRHKAWSQGSELEPKEKHPKVPAAQPASSTKSSSEQVHDLHGRNPAVPGSHLIYKKQINNPFQGMHLRGHPVSKGYIVQKTYGLKPSCIGPEEKPFRRAGSSDPSRVFDGEAQPPYLEQCCDNLEAETRNVATAPDHPVSDDFRGGPGNYPLRTVLPSHARCCSFRESILRAGVYHEENKVLPEVLRKSWSDCDMFLGTKDMQQVLPAQRCSLDPDSSVYAEDKTVDKTLHQFQNLGLLDCPVGANRLRTHERQDGDSEELSRKAFQIPEAETMNMENKGLSDSEQDEVALSQSDPGAGDDGGCSSLCLEDDDFSETDDFCHTLPGRTQYSFAGRGTWHHLGRPDVTGRSLTDCHSKTDRLEPPAIERNHWYKATGLFSNAGESPNPDLTDNPGQNSGTPWGFNYEGEPTVAHVQTPAAAGGSLLECSTVRKTSFPVEILHDSPGDRGKNPTVWRQSLPSQEMKEHFTDKLQLVKTSHGPVLAREPQREHSHLEGTENYSVTGDSGIDSPRTQSLASTNSAILDRLQRRQNRLQTREGVQKSQNLASNSLFQLTPAINV